MTSGHEHLYKPWRPSNRKVVPEKMMTNLPQSHVAYLPRLMKAVSVRNAAIREGRRSSYSRSDWAKRMCRDN